MGQYFWARYPTSSLEGVTEFGVFFIIILEFAKNSYHSLQLKIM